LEKVESVSCRKNQDGAVQLLPAKVLSGDADQILESERANVIQEIAADIS
jgi:hypothetical protein